MNKIPRIAVLSRKEVEASEASINNIIISIRSPGERRAIVGGNEPKDVLWLEFNDVDEQGKVWTLHGNVVKKCKRFTEEEAKRVIEFVNKYKDEVELIICHCEAGISRSAGLAAALYTIFGAPEKDAEIWAKRNELGQLKHHPNVHVYQTMLAAANMSLAKVYRKMEKENDCQETD
jgi:predicted protein tyrosine phosphatase